VKLTLAGAANVEATAQNSVADAWEVLEFDFSGENPGTDLDRMVFSFDEGVAGDGSTYYFDDVTYAVDNDATLSDLKVDNETIFGFAPEITDYTIELPFGTEANDVPVVTATANDIGANAIVNATELVSYDLIKEAIISHKLLSDNMPCHFVSAFCAGFCTTVIASPVDVVKTRFMNAPVGVYKGAVHCATTMFREGGIQAFYKG
jgi:solute carrier family 25 uncoupling protein 8/9